MTEQSRSERLEPGSVSTRWVSVAAGGFLAMLAASIVLLGVFFYTVVPGNRIPAYREFPRPRQEAHPEAELNALLARQHKELNSYRWINPEHTLVGIPIERAMEIIASRGDKAYGPIEQQPNGAPQPPAQAPSASSSPPPIAGPQAPAPGAGAGMAPSGPNAGGRP